LLTYTGYYFPNQTDYVSGLKSKHEVERFTPFLGNNSYILDWDYSNPDYTMEFEFYDGGPSVVTRETRHFTGRLCCVRVVVCVLLCGFWGAVHWPSLTAGDSSHCVLF
jgi:hypothetical protein